MRFIILKYSCLILLMVTCKSNSKNESYANNITIVGNEFTLVIHGGAGTINKKNMSPKKEKAYKKVLTKALEAGKNILENDGTAIEAVNAAVVIMENSSLFNAGRGSVFNHEGGHEMEAAIMDGSTLNSGGVIGVVSVKNPINLAKLVLEETEHAILAGDGANTFAEEMGVELRDEDYFYSKKRYLQLQRAKKREKVTLDHDDGSFINEEDEKEDKKFGTVGAVAKDKHGNLAAATSTGGLTNKKFGRVGDSPIVGAGTYANNETCAVSCTGQGEFFLKKLAAYDVSALMDYKNISLKEASEIVIHQKIKDLGGKGGLIAVDKSGNFVMEFNTRGMYRGYVSNNHPCKVKIYKDK